MPYLIWIDGIDRKVSRSDFTVANTRYSLVVVRSHLRLYKEGAHA